ncbi:hypothetical protein [Paracoccus sp. IB05]|uniref:DUF6950 family protein n=1 Tax=Paracoccus sp. IB05 TaxID=2779367 RepID=UPI0018E7B0D1|nr:hypothetical protein [Paracoccus sp. IB05]MBJ2150599.1 hypothetical protein [Paracoccus sp. IB05]
MTRHPEWRARLTAFIAEHSRTAYRPGRHDCILFAGGARLAVRGEDLTGPYIGRYRTIAGGLKLLRTLGHADHVSAITGGLEQIPVAYAQVGDLVELEGEDGLAAMGVVGGEHIYALTPRGAGLVLLTSARRAWRQ